MQALQKSRQHMSKHIRQTSLMDGLCTAEHPVGHLTLQWTAGHYVLLSLSARELA